MGNVTEKLAESKYELSLGAIGFTWLGFLLYQKKQNR